jgi:uncharacterized protein (TIGR02646 family)
MRRVDHRTITPAPLTGERVLAARRAIIKFLTLREEESSTRRAPLDEKLYQSGEVREALGRLFHNKCAYCETQSISSLNIEHHRPTSNAGGGRQRLPHHYAWLAYDWENLLLVCHECGRRKRNSFPLDGARAPLAAQLTRVRAQERPKLLDPGYDRPQRHLDFTLDGRCHPLTKRGGATIGILELNRESLIKERRQIFSILALQLSTLKGDDLVKALRELDDDLIPFAGGQQILRYRFLSVLARRTGHFAFKFEDASGLIESILAETSPNDIANTLRTLETDSDWTAGKAAPIPALRPFTPPIKRIEIENFKAIDHVVIDMEPMRKDSSSSAAIMLLGENATGKSSLLEAVTLALVGTAAANKLATPRDVAPDPLRGGHRAPYGPTKVTIEFWEGPPAELTISRDNKFEGSAEPRANVLAYSSRRYFMPGRRRRLKSGGPRGLFDASWSLPHPELWLRELGADRFPEIARALAEILLLPQGSYLKQDEERGVYIVQGEFETPLARHSEGYRSLFATAVDMLRGLMGGVDLLDAQGVVLIDEVETHLHPRWKMRVMSAMRKALPRVQFIVTTHDPLCLRGMGPGEVQVMSRGADNRIGLVPDLPDVSGMRIDQILTSEHFGMQSTLDPDFQELFDRYYRLLRDSQKDPNLAAEIDLLRKEINEKQRIGQTEREQHLLAAIDRHIALRVSTLPERTQQDQAFEVELDAIFNDAKADPA